MNALFATIRYKINVILFNFRFNLFGFKKDKIWQYLKWEKIECILRFRGVDKSKIEEITLRYFNYKLYLQKKESKEALHQLMEFIGEWSKDSGISQWDAREIINRDFHIDV